MGLVEEEVVTDHQHLPCFVAVHVGAGYHSQSKTGSYRNLCDIICRDVLKLLQQGYTARKAVATAIALLEVHFKLFSQYFIQIEFFNHFRFISYQNSPLTNAGVGSNLTLNERIECDASIMDKEGYGAVGALSNVKNPIMVSLSLLEAQYKGTLSMGRIVPW